jgi:hypothetical protein
VTGRRWLRQHPRPTGVVVLHALGQRFPRQDSGIDRATGEVADPIPQLGMQKTPAKRRPISRKARNITRR